MNTIAAAPTRSARNIASAFQDIEVFEHRVEALHALVGVVVSHKCTKSISIPPTSKPRMTGFTSSGLGTRSPIAMLSRPIFSHAGQSPKTLSGVTIAPECTILGPETGQTTEISNARRHPQRRPRKAGTGSISLGCGVRLTRSVEIAIAMKMAGFDWLFLDLEHGTMSIDAGAQIATAALDAGIAPLARVPNGEYSIATRLLDNGVLGIVVPHVDTADEAREVVKKLKYPPVGHRSMGGTGPHYGLRSASTGEAAEALNAANLTVVMLETPTAIANADAIAAVPGVDVLLIGTNDLCAEMGIHGDFGQRTRRGRVSDLIAACKKHGKFPGMAGIYNEPLMQRYIEMGARFILSGNDATFLMAAATARTAFMHKIFGG